ncbi:ABC transporter permease [Paenibacillus hemerocallicola]|jgi:ABC-2 type transport system permease protein|uniref:ABC transporter permease n=1 Tax=Paenibacillus hemerocallicola TaxID=1172614 RepID=A0A5C4T2Z6_9BACL|nr:ABC transporter permease subunit [Paenibacillus hemerocallicola]TNJ63432.1 ABC transporter permease [Paenibacillus hemerocallicola]
MRRAFAICSKELQLYFYSPTAYVAFAFYVLLSSIMFYLNFVLTSTSIVDARLVVGNTTFIFLFIIPLLTMRLVSDEFRQGTDEMLLTSPASITEIVMGKYLAALTLQLMLVVCSLIYPWIMSGFGDLDQTVLWLSYLSMFLLGASMMAIGLFASTLSNNQMVAGIAAFVILLLLWIIDWAGEGFGGKLKEWVNQFSLTQRQVNLQKGIFHLGDIMFYVLLVAVFLVLSIQALERKRWR